MTAAKPSSRALDRKLTMSPAQAVARLIQPGGRFEMEERDIRGVSTRVWKNAPPTVLALLDTCAAFADREFIVFESDRVSYGAFLKAVRTLAAELSHCGVGKGDVVAIIAPNTPEWMVSYFATLALGAIAAPLNPAAPVAELKLLIEDSRARLAIVDGERNPRAVDTAIACPSLERIFTCRCDQAPQDSRTERLEAIIGSTAQWDDLEAPRFPDIALDADDDASIFYTSGTTGDPKGVLVTHRNLVCNIFHAAFRLARSHVLSGVVLPDTDPSKTPPVICLAPLPLFHVGGSATMIFTIMARGGKLVFMRWWLPKRALELIERERVTVVGGVATLIEQLLDHPDRMSRDLSSLIQVIHGGAPARATLAARTLELGFTPGQNWGMTETSGGFIGHMGLEYEARPDSCGLTAPVNDIHVVGFGQDRSLPPGEVGELRVRGPQIMKGYWHKPQATAEALVDGWLRTGDIAYLDDEGYCHIVDRLKDMLICGGENVYCGEVENVLAQHPAVREAGVIGIADQAFGEVPVAAVVLLPDVVITDQDLRVFLRERLSPFKTPARFHLRREPLPRNDGGKIRKDELRRLLALDGAGSAVPSLP